jgi:lia operon protein LiaG
MQRLMWATGALALMAAVSPPGVDAQERYAIGGSHVAIFNIAGQVDVVGTAGGQVTVDVVRGGGDASELRVEVGPLNGRHVLRVIYPGSRVVYPGVRWRGTSQMMVRQDGTWGGTEGGRGERVTVASTGSGLEAYADLRVGVPRGQRVDLYLGVGRIVAENVDGQVRLQTSSGAVEARRGAGHLVVQTGSGRVDVAGMDGALVVRTGAGRVAIGNVSGDSVSVRTGSGRVSGDGLVATTARVQTGSGRVQIRRSAARSIFLQTGSGSLSAELVDPVTELHARTGSGSVTLDLARDLDAAVHVRTGSGRIQVGFPLTVTRQARRELRGTIGEGNGRIQVNTGSGGVRIRSL